MLPLGRYDCPFNNPKYQLSGPIFCLQPELGAVCAFQVSKGLSSAQQAIPSKPVVETPTTSTNVNDDLWYNRHEWFTIHSFFRISRTYLWFPESPGDQRNWEWQCRSPNSQAFFSNLFCSLSSICTWIPETNKTSKQQSSQRCGKEKVS